MPETQIKLEYGLDEKIPFFKSVLLGLQWAAILIASIIILGKVVGSFHSVDLLDQVIYLQKLLFLSAVMLICQVLWGHRLPVVPGPAAVLLIGVVVSQASDISTIYSCVLVGGVVIAFMAAGGLFKYIQKLFTANVVAAVLLLIAFTLAPSIQQLILDQPGGIAPLFNLCFAFIFMLALFFLFHMLRGILKSTLIIWGMILGSIIYFILFPHYQTAGSVSSLPFIGSVFKQMLSSFSIRPGVLISFMVCYVALCINDLGSIQSVNEYLDTKDQKKRIARGIFFTGIGNITSGFFGVIGPVNYSLSAGVISSTGCASRFTLLPCAAIMVVLSFSPSAIGWIGSIPSVVIGSVLAYVMTSQVAAGFAVLFKGAGAQGIKFETGLVIGLSMLLGTIVSFLPKEIIQTLPTILRPTLGNGFVVGVVSALVLEHVIFRGNNLTTQVD